MSGQYATGMQGWIEADLPRPLVTAEVISSPIQRGIDECRGALAEAEGRLSLLVGRLAPILKDSVPEEAKPLDQTIGISPIHEDLLSLQDRTTDLIFLINSTLERLSL